MRISYAKELPKALDTDLNNSSALLASDQQESLYSPQIRRDYM